MASPQENTPQQYYETYEEPSHRADNPHAEVQHVEEVGVHAQPTQPHVGGVPCYFNEAQSPAYAIALHNCFTAYISEIILQVDRVALQLHQVQTEMRDMQMQTTGLQIKTAQCLPPIYNIADLRNLSDEAVMLYCRGYGISTSVVPKEYWRVQIAKFIGCREQQIRFQ
ncbi:hypothetical protein V5O48_008864 [Marasmius crinis-equi]|uniref:Mug135-like C-terminal domain-containing protein n=1 Tax=Marasmius crinis-equi TaxID=585013 RepID=A0ABR3FCP0_9AGAR